MNVPVSGSYPAVEFQPTETSSVYHTDQEFTDSSGSSHMYRTYNAQYIDGSWQTLPMGPSDAYATVQHPDGSIHYYWNNGAGSWTDWVGSGNNAVYNAVDYGLVEGSGKSPATRAANVAAIQKAIDAATEIISAGNGGGTVVIPAGTYELGGTAGQSDSATINISNVNGGLSIRGESAGTILIQYGIPSGGEGQSTAADIFDVSAAGNPNQFGVRFRELWLQYASGLSVENGAVAINCISGVACVTAEYCVFFDCPQAFAAGSGPKAGLHCGLFCCEIYLDNNGYPNSTQILLSGPEAFALYCELFQLAMTNDPPGPLNCTGIAVTNSAEGCRIDGCHIAQFYTGISISGKTDFTYITNCEVNAAVGLIIRGGAGFLNRKSPLRK